MGTKYIVITGASSGIGYAAAKEFAKQNKNLVLVARRKGRLEQLKKEILSEIAPIEIIIKEKDLSITKNVYDLFEELQDVELEAWINNAGVGSHDEIYDMELDKAEAMLHLNVEAVLISSMLFLKKYRDVANTQIINVSSGAGYSIFQNCVAYCGTKFFVSSFTEGLARELLQSDAETRAKLLVPEITETEFDKVVKNDPSFDYSKNFEKYTTSEEMAEFLLALYNSNEVVGQVNANTYEFELHGPHFNYFSK